MDGNEIEIKRRKLESDMAGSHFSGLIPCGRMFEFVYSRMMPSSGGQLAVPPGFRFHPTDEELLHYYLRKKVAYEAIDLDVIREVDVNKLEPWDLKDKCRIGSGPQNDWYFFSHKDKKYPTGTRTNRATMAGFWKATGRDKAIFHGNNSRRLGMRKTLVFYTGRAPHGHKTDWIMHEYRLDDETLLTSHGQEDGWVVCRVFKKKTYQAGIAPPDRACILEEEEQEQAQQYLNSITSMGSQNNSVLLFQQIPCTDHSTDSFSLRPSSIHLPRLLSTEAVVAASGHVPPLVLPPPPPLPPPPERLTADWSILDKLLASHRNLDQLFKSSNNSPSQLTDIAASSAVYRSPLSYLGWDAELLKHSD
ncbi:hypothetical protein ZIOFF_066339 [Zingiber officinale]|uniref:NAC domain-containing protein n=2 Tax=Zingiber officinale TaxID=94328 RepID=A0A8J5F1V7_ZINOF|nr:hypothetical protein ZIOFF_066339 [Zingiber officinale]